MNSGEKRRMYHLDRAQPFHGSLRRAESCLFFQRDFNIITILSDKQKPASAV